MPVLAIHVSKLRGGKCTRSPRSQKSAGISNPRLESRAGKFVARMRALANSSPPFSTRRARKLKSRHTRIASDEH
ncbi:hypothetical protein DFH09DRAFT_1336528 [Mycena vulgaris]|nr:hypothetical protein DFH09DRAFT_1336528 [Mycena vulgaris]